MNVYEHIVELLKEEPLLKDFKYVKSKHSFVKKIGNIHYELDLYHVFTFNFWVNIYPTIGVRYEILQKWYEPFCFRTLRDQRNSTVYGADFWPDLLGLERCFCFDYDEQNFDEIYPAFLHTVRALIMEVVPKFQSVDDYYNIVVKPILYGSAELPGVGSEWIFEYLAAARIVAPEKYDELKAIIMNHVKLMVARGEPNVIEYEGKWDEIFAYLESLDFSSGKAREPKATTKKTRKSKEKKDE